MDLNTQAMQAEGLSPVDVQQAIADQNLILPAGTAKIGSYEYQVDMNGAPQTIEELNNLPVKQVGNSTIYIHDVANVRDGFPPQTNIVRVDGKRAALLSILKGGDVSTLDIVSNVKKLLPTIEAGLPPSFRAQPLADQSIFVLAAIHGVVREGVIAGCLTAFMILVFLGSWRSTLIIAVSIPLSVLTSLIVLSALGQTVNIMTLGGLALAVGILVDDATVEVENINRNLDQGKEIIQAILDGASQIAVPALVSTLSICIVFVPMFFLSGVAEISLRAAGGGGGLRDAGFLPAVAHAGAHDGALSAARSGRKTNAGGHREVAESAGADASEVRDRLRSIFACGTAGCWTAAIRHRKLIRDVLFVGLRPVVRAGSPGGAGFLSARRQPRIQLPPARPHRNAHRGDRRSLRSGRKRHSFRRFRRASSSRSSTTSVFRTAASICRTATRRPSGRATPTYWSNWRRKHRPTLEYVRELRVKLNRDFPGVQLYDLPTDMVSNILNFGLPAPIDIQIAGRDVLADRQFADNLLNELKIVPGVVDLRIQQLFNGPQIAHRGGPHQGQRDRVQRRRRRTEPADFPQRKLSDAADLLARSAEWRELQHLHANAGIPDRFASEA